MPILMALGLAGLIVDWFYIRRGGVRPTREEKRGLGYALAFTVIAILALALLGGSPAGLGSMAGLMTSLIVFLWSARRYVIRRRALRAARVMTATD